MHVSLTSFCTSLLVLDCFLIPGRRSVPAKALCSCSLCLWRPSHGSLGSQYLFILYGSPCGPHPKVKPTQSFCAWSQRCRQSCSSLNTSHLKYGKYMGAPNYLHGGGRLGFTVDLFSNSIRDLQAMWIWESHLTGLFFSLIWDIVLII